MSAVVHNFREDLARSHAAEDWAGWEKVYRSAFPTFAAMINHRQDGWHQRAGIDRSVILSDSRQVFIDEKVRGRNARTGQVYQDIALESWSDRDHHTPGWVSKPLRADYIAYAIPPLGKCYLLPVIQLQSAWRSRGAEWILRFGEKESLNEGWVTVFVPVPVDVLFPAIGDCLRVKFEPEEFTEAKT